MIEVHIHALCYVFAVLCNCQFIKLLSVLELLPIVVTDMVVALVELSERIPVL